jgi:hypothetical protein
MQLAQSTASLPWWPRCRCGCSLAGHHTAAIAPSPTSTQLPWAPPCPTTALQSPPPRPPWRCRHPSRPTTQLPLAPPRPASNRLLDGFNTAAVAPSLASTPATTLLSSPAARGNLLGGPSLQLPVGNNSLFIHGKIVNAVCRNHPPLILRHHPLILSQKTTPVSPATSANSFNSPPILQPQPPSMPSPPHAEEHEQKGTGGE